MQPVFAIEKEEQYTLMRCKCMLNTENCGNMIGTVLNIIIIFCFVTEHRTHLFHTKNMSLHRYLQIF